MASNLVVSVSSILFALPVIKNSWKPCFARDKITDAKFFGSSLCDQAATKYF